jgi:threo-3-hydroxy-L-aspartate ammonia-lyase
MKTLDQAIRPTTFIESAKLSKILNCELTIATETFQHTGSFKFRAAYNVAVNVENTHIIAASSGNFGQAMAFACALTNKKCTIVMPETSAKVKIDAVRSYGATADLVDTKKVGRNERVAQLANEFPDAYIGSAYDDLLVIDGNSTLGDELSQKNFDVIISPIGGGGLISGISKGLCRNGNQAKLIGAEPLLGNYRSIRRKNL